MVLLLPRDIDIPRYPVSRLSIDGGIEVEDLLAPVRGALWVWRCAEEDLKACRILRRALELDIKEASKGLNGSSLYDLKLKMLLQIHLDS